MLPIVEIRNVAQYAGQEVVIQGWLYNLRESGKLLFPLFRDGTGTMQGVIVKSAVAPEVFEQARHLTQESSVRVTGKVRADQRAPGGFELDVSELEVLQRVSPETPYPITPKEHGIEFLMDHRHLWLRSTRQRAILGVRHEIIKACRDFFDERGFTLVDTPIFTPAACEGTTTLFEVNYFDDKAYLTQSGQLYNEAAAAAVGKTYCFGPTFRAEKSKTRRHLTEFWMIEPEVAFARLDDVCALAEQLVAFVVERVLARRRAELATLERDVAKLEACTLPFPRLSYDEAVKVLREKGCPIEWGGDFGGADETILSERFDRPVLVTRYPSQVKAFYMAPDPARPEVALCVDVLAPEGYGEIIGGGERLADLDLLLKRIEEQHLPRQAFEWYLDLRRYGSVPHAGFGMGIERVVGWICGLEHVRETIPFPRMLYRLTP
ncbi:MAG: asparagine--tRNA ligase [Acidobacteria bacterium]|nr:MAG: asparagine--tRNA ligase [Acidobacteriota bacterium]PYV28004.1 MAG: asparagine--tRNA ligase [Acidobacteriota bacterium]